MFKLDGDFFTGINIDSFSVVSLTNPYTTRAQRTKIDNTEATTTYPPLKAVFTAHAEIL